MKRLGIFVDPFTFRLNTAWPTYWPLAYTPIPMRQKKKILIDQSSVIYIYAMLSIPFFDLIFATFFIIKKTKSNERASISVQFYQLKCSDFSNENWMTWKCKQIVSFAGYRIDMFFLCTVDSQHVNNLYSVFTVDETYSCLKYYCVVSTVKRLVSCTFIDQVRKLLNYFLFIKTYFWKSTLVLLLATYVTFFFFIFFDFWKWPFS